MAPTEKKVTDTSREAFQNIQPKLAASQERVLAVFLEHPKEDFTAREILKILREDFPGYEICSLTPILHGLRKRKILTRIEKRRCSVTGMNAYPHVLVWGERWD